jgi:hypothetical protein
MVRATRSKSLCAPRGAGIGGLVATHLTLIDQSLTICCSPRQSRDFPPSILASAFILLTKRICFIHLGVHAHVN